MAEFDQGVETAESPTADTSAQADTSAGTQNTDQAEAQVPFHQHPRWQERTREIQGLRQQNQHLNTTLQQLHGRLQQLESSRSPSTPPSQEEQAAREALHRLDPSLKNVGEYGQKLQKIEGALQQFMEQQTTANVQRGQQHIATMLKSAGLPANPEYVQRMGGSSP